MLEEAWYWLTLMTSPQARRLGYRKEAAALRARHRRCRDAWRAHLEATRAVLLESARRACADRGGGSGLILGGGILRDVPWRELLARFDSVEIVDIVIHPEVRAACAESGGRLRYEVADITGCVEMLARSADPLRALAHDWSADLVKRCTSHRWVASVNILTQLALLPAARLRSLHAPEAAVAAFAQTLHSAHLDGLLHAPGAVCLVTEIRDHRWEATGALIDEGTREAYVLTHLAARTPLELARWQWHLHPPGELPGGETESREIVCLHLPPAR